MVRCNYNYIRAQENPSRICKIFPSYRIVLHLMCPFNHLRLYSRLLLRNKQQNKVIIMKRKIDEHTVDPKIITPEIYPNNRKCIVHDNARTINSMTHEKHKTKAKHCT